MASAQLRDSVSGANAVAPSASVPPNEPLCSTFWHSSKLGNGISLDASLTKISRHSKTGWGCQLGESWYGVMAQEDQATITLEIKEFGANAFVGFVDHSEADSNKPRLAYSPPHAIMPSVSA